MFAHLAGPLVDLGRGFGHPASPSEFSCQWVLLSFAAHPLSLRFVAFFSFLSVRDLSGKMPGAIGFSPNGLPDDIPTRGGDDY